MLQPDNPDRVAILGELGDPFGQPRDLSARRIFVHDTFLCGPHQDGLSRLQGFGGFGPVA